MVDSQSQLDKDIDYHREQARVFLALTNRLLFSVALLAMMYLIPDISIRMLPYQKQQLEIELDRYRKEKAKFEVLHGKRFYFVSQTEYDKAERRQTSTQELNHARYVSTLVPTRRSTIVSLIGFLAGLKIDEPKIRFLGQMLLTILGGGVTAFLLTYRHHVRLAHDIVLKKISLLENESTHGLRLDDSD